jgi:hypothetical protein
MEREALLMKARGLYEEEEISGLEFPAGSRSWLAVRAIDVPPVLDDPGRDQPCTAFIANSNSP